MGQIKNIKLHIVTDIKSVDIWRYTKSNTMFFHRGLLQLPALRRCALPHKNLSGILQRKILQDRSPSQCQHCKTLFTKKKEEPKSEADKQTKRQSSLLRTLWDAINLQPEAWEKFQREEEKLVIRIIGVVFIIMVFKVAFSSVENDVSYNTIQLQPYM